MLNFERESLRSRLLLKDIFLKNPLEEKHHAFWYLHWRKQIKTSTKTFFWVFFVFFIEKSSGVCCNILISSFYVLTNRVKNGHLFFKGKIFARRKRRARRERKKRFFLDFGGALPLALVKYFEQYFKNKPPWKDCFSFFFNYLKCKFHLLPIIQFLIFPHLNQIVFLQIPLLI